MTLSSHLKWPPGAILSKKRVTYRSELARNAIESYLRTSKSEFRTSKMTDGSHFVKKFPKKLKLRIDLKWPEMRSKVNFGHPKWPTAAISSKISIFFKVAYRSEMARNAVESEFRTSKMGAGVLGSDVLG